MKSEPSAASTERSRSAHAIVLAGDEQYAQAVAVAMHSALEHLSPAVVPEIHVLDGGIGEASRQRLRRVAGRPIAFTALPLESLAGLPARGHLTAASYARLLIPDLMPGHIRRVVYLDADVLVRTDMAPLFHLDLASAPLAAVRDYAIGSNEQRWPNGPEALESRPYFNAGLLVLDVARWRTSGLAQHALAYAAASGPQGTFMDQDAMNAVAEEWHELDYGWNVQQSLHYLEQTPPTEFRDELIRGRADLFRDAALLHFSGLPKPWYHGSFVPGTMPWVRALMRSGWFERAEGVMWLVSWLAKRAGVRVLRR